MEMETLTKIVARAIADSNLVAKLFQELRDLEPSFTLPETDNVIVAGALTIDVARREAFLDGQPLGLKPQEFLLLKVLASHPGRVFSRDLLLELAWRDGGMEIFPRSVDVHVSRVRTKMGSARRLVRTVPGIGYGLDDEVERTGSP